MNEELIKAIWNAAWENGRKCGEDHAMAWERGSRSRSPKTPEKAWDEEIPWRQQMETGFSNIEDPEFWPQI